MSVDANRFIFIPVIPTCTLPGGISLLLDCPTMGCMDVSLNQRSERYSSEGYGGGSEEAANYALLFYIYIIPASKSETCDHMYILGLLFDSYSSLRTSSGNISKGQSNEVPLQFTPISLH